MSPSPLAAAPAAGSETVIWLIPRETLRTAASTAG